MNYSIWLENECMVTKHKHTAGYAEIKVPVLPSRNNFSELPWIIHMCIIFLQAPEKVSNSSYKCTGYKVNCNSENNAVKKSRGAMRCKVKAEVRLEPVHWISLSLSIVKRQMQTCLTMAFSAGSHVASVALATSAPPPSSVSCSLFLACVCKGGGFLLSAETSLSGRADCEFCAFLTSSF